MRQLRLNLGRPVSYAPADYVAGPSNARAMAAVQSWPGWHGGLLALVGEDGCGKSHLARIWAERADAVELDRGAPDLAAAAGRPVLLEDVDQGVDPEALFHLINMAAQPGGGLLLTARTAPITWPAPLPDLRSRLNAMPVAEIEPPDDEVLEGVLRKLFKERGIRPSREVYPYLLRRIPRSVAAARDVVARLDEAAESRPVSRALAREILEDDAENIDLFDG